MSKSSAESSRSRSGTFPSPGTPNYTRYGWSSERVPLKNTTVLPFNHGKKLPSKWEDAEKWILSPVSGANRTPGPPAHHRRPKSKSGPLGGHTEGYAACSSSPAPFLAGVLIPEHGSFGNSDDCGGNNGILRSVSVNGWMDTLMEATAALPPSRQTKPEEKVQITKEAVERITASIMTKDVATQMSSEESATSSPKELSFSYSGPIEEVNNNEGCNAKMEVRDVEIDKQVTVTRWSKKNVLRSFDKRSVDSKGGSSANWEERERVRCTNKSKKEEAKITAWENLQKAKAEAEIRKLEMKLERKRESSMERILSRLRRAQKKAEGMRQSVSSDQDHCVRKPVGKPSPFRRTGKHTSFTGCFPCVVFK
ncbi:hypothetical protein LUZ60_001277 [Juncus effusus]|nr:hypothetical protein LUZ60_001277 [Juncus effusus]